MSGIEITGLVLGSIPLVISALEHYAEGVETIKRLVRYKKEIEDLIHILQAEYSIYLDTAEFLLNGLIPTAQLEELLQDLDAPLWKRDELAVSLKQRLNRSYDVYMQTINDMKETLDGFRAKLDLNLDGKVQWIGEKGMKVAWKLGRFSLSRKQYDDLIARLQRNNRILTELTNRSVALEPSRRKRRDTSRLKKVGEYAQSLFHALQSSFGCKCKDKHTAILDLSTDPADTSKMNSQKESIEFHVVISCAVHRQGKMEDRMLVWQESRIQPVEESSLLKLEPQKFLNPQDLCATESTTRAKSPSRWRPKGVRFSSDSSVIIKTSSQTTMTKATSSSSNLSGVQSLSKVSSTISKTTTSIPGLDPMQSTVYLSSICKVVTSSSMTMCKTTECRGYILDGKRKFLFFSLGRSGDPDQGWSTISLSEVLRKAVAVPRLSFPGKLRLAATVSSAVLRFHDSPWLRSKLIDKDIVFLNRMGTSLYDQIYVSRQLPDMQGISTTQTAPMDFLSSVYDQTLLALAIILIEISLGKPLEQWQTEEDRKEGGTLANAMTVLRILHERVIRDEIGEGYEAAVKSCLDLAKSSSSKFDEKAQQNFYDGVVSVLEQQASIMSST